MKLPAVLNTKAAAYGAAILVGGVVIYVIVSGLGKKALDKIANINEGTPYEGTGPVGTLGHATDAVSGGLLSTFGGWLGRTIYDATHKEYKP